MHNDLGDLALDCNESMPSGDAEPFVETPPAAAERKKEEKEEEEEEEGWGDERRCYLLGQEHDSWEVREREAGK